VWFALAAYYRCKSRAVHAESPSAADGVRTPI
jgi:hypothetical protein